MGKHFKSIELLILLLAYTYAEHVICYYGSWATYRNNKGKCDIGQLDPNACTVLIYGFAGLNSRTYEIQSLDPYNDLIENWGKGSYKRFNDLRKINPNLKTLIAIGGWNEGSTKYSNMAATSEGRKRFIQSVIKFISTHGFNGLDLDWEYPTKRGGIPADKQNFVKLLLELRQEFNKHGYLLSAAVAAGIETVDQAYDVPSLSKYLDFINVMTYDFHGSWDKNVGHNAPLYARPDESSYNKLLNVNASIHHYIKRGAARNKLNLGMGSYGQAFTLVNPKRNTLNAPALGPGNSGPYTQQAGMLGYNEICEKMMKEAWTVVRDIHYQAPYAYSGDQWVGYDDVESIAIKSHFAKSLGLGGGMIWSIETDDFRGTCGRKFPLIHTISEIMQNSKKAPQAPNSQNKVNPKLQSTSAIPTGHGKTTEVDASRYPLDAPSNGKRVSLANTAVKAKKPEESKFLETTTIKAIATNPTRHESEIPKHAELPTSKTTSTTTTRATTMKATVLANKVQQQAEHSIPTTKANFTPTKTTAKTTIKKAIPDEIIERCTPNGYVRHSRNCAIFYKCVQYGDSYNVYRFRCQAGLYFDIEINTCNWRYSVRGCK